MIAVIITAYWQTCKYHRPGSFGHYVQDANTLAGWGVDFIKTDNCAKPGNYTEQQLYTEFSNAINATGRLSTSDAGSLIIQQADRYSTRCASGASRMWSPGVLMLRRCTACRWIIFLSGTFRRMLLV